jgi:hypothetical protein
MNPLYQIKAFLAWFLDQGVNAFDLHVRRPKGPNEDYDTDNWVWVTHNENIGAEYIQAKLLPWIKYENVKGSDIFFRPHKDAAHPVIFLDDITVGNAFKVAQKYTACVVETSTKNTQVWLATDKRLHKRYRKTAQKVLRDKGYSDPGSISGDHLGRLCGVKSQKHKTWVNLIRTSVVKPYIPGIDFSSPPADSQESPCGNNAKVPSNSVGVNYRGFCASKSAGYDKSASGQEWGWVLGMLKNNMEPNNIEKMLSIAASDRGKKNAAKYASYTVKKAIITAMSYHYGTRCL